MTVLTVPRHFRNMHALSVLTETPATYILMYRNASCGTLLQIQEKVIWIVQYLVAEFR